MAVGVVVPALRAPDFRRRGEIIGTPSDKKSVAKRFRIICWPVY